MIFENAIISIFIKRLNSMIEVDKLGNTSPDGLTEIRDIPYKSRDGHDLRLDIYKPQDTPADAKLPAVIYVHGGALIEGDKIVATGYCRQIAKRGYVVCAVEYRLIPQVRVYEQFADVCAGLDKALEIFPEHGGDIDRIYLTGESAGAYLSVYVTAMQKSEALAKAIGCEPPRPDIKAMGLLGGMFYTIRRDEIGKYLSRSIYGTDERSHKFAPFKDPENPEILCNIPPCYFMTSKHDMIERYTLDFAGALGSKGIEYKLHLMGSDPRFVHAFPILRPQFPETELVLDEMMKWFESHK